MAAGIYPILNRLSVHFTSAQPQLPVMGSLGRFSANAGPILSTFSGNSNHRFVVLQGSLSENRQVEKDEQAESQAKTATVAGGVLVVVMAGLSAFSLRLFSDNREDLAEAKKLKGLLEQHPEFCEPVYVNDVNALIGELEEKKGQTRTIVAFSAASLALAGTAFLGGMLAIQWLITASIIGGVALAAIGIGKVVWDCTARRVSPLNMKQNSLQELHARLREQQQRPSAPVIDFEAFGNPLAYANPPGGAVPQYFHEAGAYAPQNDQALV